MSTHQVCGHEGCTFSAIPKVLKEHREREHSQKREEKDAKAKVVARKSKAFPAETEEEISAYLAERRANYPTKANLKRKLEMETKRKELGQLEPGASSSVQGEKGKRMKRLKEILETQKSMGLAKMAGTEKLGGDLGGNGGKKAAAAAATAPGSALSLVPYSSDSDSEEAKAKPTERKPKRGKAASGPKGRRNQNSNGRPHHKKKEESLVSKLLAKSVRKEKSHVLQCLRFLVKTEFKMAFA